MRPAERPEVLVLGHVTRDELADGPRLGGAVSYAGLAAAAPGHRVRLITAAPADAPLLEPLRAEPAIELVLSPSEVMTTFALDYTGGGRTLALRARAPSLGREALAGALAAAEEATRPRAPAFTFAYLGPVIGECSGELIAELGGAFVVVGLQGWLREVGPDGRVRPALSPETNEPPPGIDLAVLSEEDHPQAAEIAALG
jgi:1D-myo-inositol 3-kinase